MAERGRGGERIVEGKNVRERGGGGGRGERNGRGGGQNSNRWVKQVSYKNIRMKRQLLEIMQGGFVLCFVSFDGYGSVYQKLSFILSYSLCLFSLLGVFFSLFYAFVFETSRCTWNVQSAREKS